MDATSKVDIEDIGKFILRLMVGGLLIFHGISKIINGVDFIKGALAAHHLPTLIAYGVYVGEVVGPLFVLVGLWTRLAALVVVVDLVAAILLVRLPFLLTMSKSGGWGMEQDAFFLLGALAICLIGPGRIKAGRRAAA